MTTNLNRPQGQPGGSARPNVPDWLLPLHNARAAGLTPRSAWIVIQAGGRIGKWVPAVCVPSGYKPGDTDDMSALHGLDCELLIDDETSYRMAQGLVAAILNAGPRRLWALTCGQRNTILVLKKGGADYGAH
ncbi:hypothetical protein [Ralstonia sp.]|uniref:hypothetical protein n=1 Tax=Ralstonia sp. TaxID=54061 RepID=UPI0031D2B779